MVIFVGRVSIMADSNKFALHVHLLVYQETIIIRNVHLKIEKKSENIKIPINVIKVGIVFKVLYSLWSCYI